MIFGRIPLPLFWGRRSTITVPRTYIGGLKTFGAMIGMRFSIALVLKYSNHESRAVCAILDGTNIRSAPFKARVPQRVNEHGEGVGN